MQTSQIESVPPPTYKPTAQQTVTVNTAELQVGEPTCTCCWMERILSFGANTLFFFTH